MSVVKINALTVPEPMRAELERRFAGRAGLVENADGFEGFELLRPVDGGDRYLVYTRWRSEEDFQRWTASQSFQEGHRQAAADAGREPAQPGHAPGQGAPGQEGEQGHGTAGHGRGPEHGQGPEHGHGHGHGHGGPAASAAELWSFEVVERAAPKAGPQG
jgi:heme-degrading monooxygenase HmoA